MAFNWLYTSWNDNEYILFLIIVILFFIIIDFKLLTRKKAKFEDIITSTTTSDNTSTTTSDTSITLGNTSTTTSANTSTTSGNTSTTSANTSTTSANTSTTTSANTSTTSSNTLGNTAIVSTTLPSTTAYQAPTASNPENNLFLSDEDKAKWRTAWGLLDGNEETVDSNSKIIKNDILPMYSMMYSSNTSANSIQSVNYKEEGNWASIDNLGKSLTDTLGGINSNLGYTILEEQLGTFKPDYNNPNVYDNTQNYKSGMNPNTISGASLYGSGAGYHQVGKSPIFMQKDFAGVANIFAPNIYVSNAPLGDDGLSDISLSGGDGKFYSV